MSHPRTEARPRGTDCTGWRRQTDRLGRPYPASCRQCASSCRCAAPASHQPGRGTIRSPLPGSPSDRDRWNGSPDTLYSSGRPPLCRRAFGQMDPRSTGRQRCGLRPVQRARGRRECADPPWPTPYRNSAMPDALQRCLNDSQSQSNCRPRAPAAEQPPAERWTAGVRHQIYHLRLANTPRWPWQ